MNIPLFPLPNLVLFPQVLLPLHIFEDRYRTMIDRCVEDDRAFGLVQLRSGAERESEETIHTAGVTARVVQVERLDDGRMNILTAGESRFRIRKFTAQLPYWTADVDLFEDVEEPELDLQAGYDEVAGLYRRAFDLGTRLKTVKAEDFALPESPVALSYMVSYVLDIDAAEKQRLLEMVSTVERLETLVGHLREAISHLQRTVVQKEIGPKVSGNGDLGLPHN
jgi:Lon protease-like protein